VKFGIGRYLYRLPVLWVDWDAAKKRFARPPQLPDWALPRLAKDPAVGARPKEQSPDTPKNAAEFLERLGALDAWGAQRQLWSGGWLKGSVMADAEANGFPADAALWTLDQVREAYEAARGLAQRKKARKNAGPGTPAERGGT
jgi:hypothetical protein